MTSKTRAFISAIVVAITGALAFISEIPTDAQTGVMESLANIFPPAWRGQIGAACKFVSVIATLYAVHQASHSGPATPPANPPV